MTEDPRVSDEATGLPPLEEVDPADAMIVLAWHGSSGVVMSPHTSETIPVRYLSVRGLIRGNPDDPHSAEWGQIHLAVPVEHAVDVAATLAAGGMLDPPAAPVVERDSMMLFPTPGFPLKEAGCRFRVIRLPDGKTVAVATEVPDNPGASITNAAEHLWRTVQGQQYDAMIEHYPPASHRSASLDEVLITANGRVSWRHIGGELRETLLAVLEPERTESDRSAD